MGILYIHHYNLTRSATLKSNKGEVRQNSNLSPFQNLLSGLKHKLAISTLLLTVYLGYNFSDPNFSDIHNVHENIRATIQERFTRNTPSLKTGIRDDNTI